MGIDFNGLIKNLGTTAARMQNNKEKIDTKTELNTFVSGWDAIKAKAEKDNVNSAESKVNVSELETQMKSELAGLLGAEFGNTAGVENKGTAEKPVFSENDISLENMMSLLEPEDGLDIDKLREYNKKPLESGFAAGEASTLNEFGFDLDLVGILMDVAPKAVRYIADAIKNGSADRIADNVRQQEHDIIGAENILQAMKQNFEELKKQEPKKLNDVEKEIEQEKSRNELLLELNKLGVDVSDLKDVKIQELRIIMDIVNDQNNKNTNIRFGL